MVPSLVSARAARSGPALAVSVLALALVFPCWPTPLSAQPTESLQQLTQRLVAQGNQYRGADPSRKRQLLGSLVEVAKQRQRRLARLIGADPDAVLRVAIPSAIRVNLPVQVHPYVEQDVEAEGSLEVLHEDRDDGSRYLYHLMMARERLSLHFVKDPPGLQTGTRVRVRGVRVGGAMALRSGGNVTALATVVPNTFGEQRTAVILFTFQDNPIQPYSPAYAEGVVFTADSSANRYYQEVSYQQTSLAGDVFGWYTIPLDSTVCDAYKAASLADQAAMAVGVNIGAYNRRIYAFPRNACAWWGLGTVGGNPSKAWINGSLQLRVVGHELGHNFGNYHSHSESCDANSCILSEYGDGWDIMGASAGHLNTFQKERLGWLTNNTSPPVTTVTGDGAYWLDPYEPLGPNSKALKILKETNAATGARTWFYVEYRAKAGFDVGLAPAVLLHSGSESSANSSHLIDLAATTSSVDWILDPGQNFTDPTSGVTISTMELNSGGAAVYVAFGSEPCVHANPTLSLTPSETQWVRPGTPVTYTVTLTNHDNSACASASFALQALLPDSTWTATWPSPTVTVSPGSSGSTTVTVTSPPNATLGFYDLRVTGQNTQNATYSASASVAQALVASLAVQVASDQHTYPQNMWVTIIGSVSTGATPASGATVTFTVTDPAGAVFGQTVLTDSNGVAELRFRVKRKDPVGVWQAQAAATVNGMSGSALTSFTVE